MDLYVKQESIQEFYMPTSLDSGDVFAILENTRAPKDNQSMLFTSPISEIYCTQGRDLESALSSLDKMRQKGYYLCGYISYETSYLIADKKAFIFNNDEKNHHPLIHFYVFKHCALINSDEVEEMLNHIAHDSSLPVAIKNLCLNMERQEYIDKIQKIKEHIRNGDTYQVNFTQKYKFEYQGSELSLYSRLRKRQKVEFGAFLHFPEFKILSLSPELFLRKTEDKIISKPMKGTFPRGASEQEDAQIIQMMKDDPKTLSENVIIVDLLRNDLSRVAKTGSVSVTNMFEVQTYETLHQMISTVTGQVSLDINIHHVIRNLFPCGSITGAPKIRTMQIIEELEKERRGIYTGAIGYISPDNNFCFNVPIRTCIAYKDGTAEMGVGSGILFESDPSAEYDECLLKALFLRDLNAWFTIFESMKYCAHSQTIVHLSEHLARLQHSAQCLHFKADISIISEKVQKAVLGLKHDHKIKVTLAQSGEISIHLSVLEPVTDSKPPVINLSDQLIDHRNFLLKHKTSIRQIYDSEYALHYSQGAYDVLFINQNGFLTEGSRHNLFIEKNGIYYTSPVRSGLLPGIERQCLLSSHDISCVEKPIKPEDLLHAEKILLTNSVRGIVQVSLSEQAINRLQKLTSQDLRECFVS